ncbi:hypothetical protein J3R82DRAFT_2240 [Butyriboletus roseoflavus]|nr:hypothetical protein J3R82DRAFT_2240 [Butyriboletus roseoflavus]
MVACPSRDEGPSRATNVENTRQLCLRTSCALALITEKVNVVVVVSRYNLRWLRACVRCALTFFVLSPSGSKRSYLELPQEAEIRYSQILRQDLCCTSSSQTRVVEAVAAPGESSSKNRRWSKRRSSPANSGPTVHCELQCCRRRSIVIWSHSSSSSMDVDLQYCGQKRKSNGFDYCGRSCAALAIAAQTKPPAPVTKGVPATETENDAHTERAS